MGYDEAFTGYDALLFVNLTGEALSDAALGIVESGPDNGFLEALLSGGFTTDPLFGGNGPTDLGMLDFDGVYETLLPAGEAMFNFSADGVTETGLSLDDGQFAFLDSSQATATVPEPASVTTLLVAMAGLAGLRARGQRRPGLTPIRRSTSTAGRRF